MKKQTALCRGLSLLLVLFLLLSLAACGAQETEKRVPASSATAASESGIAASPDAASLNAVLLISEVMTHNLSFFPAAGGAFPDWIELLNAGEEPSSLSGWSLSDGITISALPDKELQPGERLLVLCSGGAGGDASVSFALSDGETLALLRPDGSVGDSFLCNECDKDYSLCRGTDGEVSPCLYPTPGLDNTPEAYEAFVSTLIPGGPVILSEACPSADGSADWVELKNVSSAPASLKGLFLSDKSGNLRKRELPDLTLQPGECHLLACDGSFSLSRLEAVYLSDSRGTLLDVLSLAGVSHNLSVGRSAGQGGRFFFSEPTPGGENAEGFRRIASAPVALTADGVYNDVDSLSLELVPSAFTAGLVTLRYTLDGSAPNEASPVYTSPFTVSKTCVLRAAAFEEGCLPSPVITVNYVINENHTLPVLCLCGDNYDEFHELLFVRARKGTEVPGNLSYYDENGSFSINCGVSIAGMQGSFALPKKSFKIHFRNRYGDNSLTYPIFDSLIDAFSSLTIRAGQDAYEMVFKNELWQDMCLAMEGDAYTLESRFCILYINGEYHGIYSLKEDLSPEYYASHTGVDPDTVQVQKFPVEYNSDFFREVITFTEKNSLADEENYSHFCELVDIDNFIDWFIIEGVSANIDLYRNIRAFRSPENGNRWEFAFFDVDLTKDSCTAPFSVLFGHSDYLSEQMADIVWKLCQNEDFLDRLLTRYGEVYDTVLSNEAILARIDYYEELLAPEMPRNAQRWTSGQTRYWTNRIRSYKQMILNYDWEECCVDNLLLYLKNCGFITSTAEVRERYFAKD